MTPTPDEQLKKLDTEIKQLKSRKQTILNREKQKQRKEQTRQLIKCGELAERYFGIENIQADKFEKFLKQFIELKGVKDCAEFVKKSLP